MTVFVSMSKSRRTDHVEKTGNFTLELQEYLRHLELQSELHY